MEKNNNIKIMGVFATVLLLVIVITASFAYFGSFNVNLNNNVAVNVNSVSPGDATFISNATQLNLQVPAANMSQTVADNSTAAASNTATLTVNLTGAKELLTTCTYDIVYEYDDGSYIYGGSQTRSVAKNGDKEITLQVSGVNGTNNFASEKNFDYDSNWSNNKRTLVSGATISSNGTLTSQNISITGKYYNLTISQSSLEGKAFTGRIYVTNHSCSTSEIQSVSITTLMSTSTQDVYDENGFRYEGTDPNNYICLDNKTEGTCSDSSLLFRIIGLFDEDTSTDGTTSSGSKKLLKVIDTNNYGGTSGKYWNSAGTNNWGTASLKVELNETYLSNLTSTVEVNSKLEGAIVNTKWHLGGANSTNETTLTADGIYREERNPSAIYSGNPSSIYAKVGLMYPSDYGYATVGNTTTNKAECRTKALFYNNACTGSSWLYTSQKYFVSPNEFVISGEHILSPYSSDYTIATVIESSGGVYFNSSRGAITVGMLLSVRPTFYLDAEAIKIVGGTGTSADPYHIG